MGRMKKAHKVIKKWKLQLTYTCPIKNKEVTVDIEPSDLSSSSSPCDLCGGHGDMTLRMYECPLCKKYHDNIEIQSW